MSSRLNAIKISTRDVPPRSQWALEQSGIPSLLARLYAARGVASRDELDDSLAKLLPPSGLLGITSAAQLLADAVRQQSRICIVADYDCDGATACAVALRGLRLLGAQHVDYLVPNRALDGYGLTPTISERVAATGAEVLMTVDNGIASSTGVARAKELGLTVIVTDHHLPVADVPAADAIVNPNQHGCTFASKAMAGVGVMFYVLLATRAELRARATWQTASEPKLDVLLPLVALGTVADVVKLDANNRRLVSQGLRRIRSGNLPVGMAALFAVAGRKSFAATTADFGFALAPRINAAGRLSDMRLGIECLTTDDAARADELAKHLDDINRERKQIEGGMRDQALEIASNLLDASEESANVKPSAISVFDPTFHEGVIGIVASRIKDQWHRPTFVFAPSGTTLKGSGRSITGFHLRDALDLIAKRHPDLLLRFGGHAMAAGCTIDEGSFALFDAAFQQVALEWLDRETLQQRLLTDGTLPASECRFDVAESLNREVWGQGFAAPVFCDTVEVVSQRIVGEKHLSLKLKHQGIAIDAIWFNRVEPLQATATLAYRLEADEWQGNKRVKWMIEAA
ncbi:MAG: single-stranded-DNA-specific exonuclease RecJ [Cytophagales bacterium]|nr:single-stranded-DNA-specific exonuclease RecJ [Cytophagales bacterium]